MNRGSESVLTVSARKVHKMKHLLILTVGAICLAVVASDYNTVKLADKDFLIKQKKIYNLLYYISQPSLVNPSLYEEGYSYNIETNIDSYTNTVKTTAIMIAQNIYLDQTFIRFFRCFKVGNLECTLQNCICIEINFFLYFSPLFISSLH